MKFDAKSRRLRERLKLSLPVRVHCRETLEHEWTEVTRLLDVTPFGARFTLSHVIEPGRLLHLTLPMPRQLRCYDYVEMQYSIWALVRNLQLQEAAAGKTAETKTGGMRFSVGVAFIGKHAPAKHEKDPTIRYEVAPNPAGLWEVRERPVQEEGKGGSVSRSKETRLQMAVEVVIEALDAQGAVTAREETVTENLSRRGAAVWTTLDAERGSYVRVTGVRSQLTILAAVRARRPGADGIPRLHLEFLGQEWPLEGVE
ncbi:MAG TPA: hypothetical protein VNA19_13905 [Pyrinomonadaceae bacterium]|jgi:hypothetical protein|nr:hypothetical protein [Pyrinomonadaceae bacterium]